MKVKKIYRRLSHCSHKEKKRVRFSSANSDFLNFVLSNSPNVNSRMFVVTTDNAADSDIVIH